ncbi:hypothetical protein L6164_025290 [Bauhinia variegata]|uniref:Uncharacterized protein n=1 Tax=Bauhinia variegata TaxID=167791 RepID=A0ACB9M054_BAUVA|nr:hypothetical protein L6164_025290 [Bauhinia variegata]
MDSNHSTDNGVGKTYPQISDDDGCLLAMLLCNGHVVPAVLNAAIELNLFGIIAKATPPCLSVTEIASQLPKQYPDLASRLERMLRLLASFSVLTCSTRTNDNGSTERVYGISPISKYLVPDSISSTLPFLCHRSYMEA